MKHYLFTCVANRQRSPTGQMVFAEMLVEAGYKVWNVNALTDADFEVYSAGTNADDEGVDMSAEIGERMDVVFTMDRCLLEELVRDYHVRREKIINLDIPDDYHKEDPRLIAIFREKLKPFIPEFKDTK